MNGRIYRFLAVVISVLIAVSCAGFSQSPSIPSQSKNLTDQNFISPAQSQAHLWGFYQIEIDPATGTVEIVGDHTAMFSANVVSHVNNNPKNLSFKINSTIVDTDFIDVDIDVSITHPFPGLTQYNGYDVRGIFIGDGSEIMKYSSSLSFAENGADQFMLDDIANADGGGPDGYTRWFNPSEFPTPGLFGYTPGIFATKGYVGDATLNPYKYFADGLGSHENSMDWLVSNETEHGVFSAGTKNTRNYYIRFPKSKGVKFDYAIVANWGGPDPADHPSNAPEVVACEVDDNSTLWWTSNTAFGGNLNMDVTLYSWFPLDGDFKVESNVLDSVNDDPWTFISSTGNSSTYNFEIPADSILGTENNYIWIIVENPDFDYTNDFGVPNLAGTDTLAAFFFFPLTVDPEPQGLVCDVAIDPSSPDMPYSGGPAGFTFDASGSYDPLGGALTFEWDFNADGIFGDSFDGGTDEKPFKIFNFDNQDEVCVKVSNGIDESECCVDVDISIDLISKNIPLRDGFDAVDLSVDHADGDLLILYSDGTVWRYTEAGDYVDGAYFISTYEPGIQFIDTAPNSYTIIGGDFPSDMDKTKIYDPSGALVVNGYIGNECYAHDVVAFTGHTYTNMLGISSFTCPMGTYFRWRFYEPPGYTIYFYANLYGGCDPTTIDRDIVIGTECGNITMWYVYVLEGGNGTCDEYRVQRVYRPSDTTITNDPTVSWGGARSDGMDGFYDPKDITRDKDNDFYILDLLSTGEPKIKKYTENGDQIGSFSDSTTISGTPLRMEGSDFEGVDGNLIFVIHDGGSTDLLSIFYPSEIPG